ncbi:Ig-like domain-containing protein [Lacinutrix sp. 5H-3-7-4]|uniref:Ig-like domain-containing protein n=1 Tax=Lacinutrix sp. (strain 5H-3-7-4) TaxID=983544 RepID=UPI0002114AF6|nr:gliding motility-associated C-terminal domain-containing protein [Lacinutrix sp. 5H-3-7-4]AEH01679.1 hemolysin-type calcium-binding region [Lacinutrix sp. 5H-3-7-4]
MTDCEETTGIDDPSTVNVPVGVTDPSDACDPIEGSDLTDSDGDGLTDCEETTGNDNPNTVGVPVGITDPNNPCDPFTDGSGCTPIAVDDNASTTPDTNVTFPITDNDSDPSAGGSIDVTSVDLDPNTPGQQGTFTVPGEGTYTDNGDGTVTFDPEPGFTGVSTPIDYTVNDNDGNPSNIATITVTVASCPSPIDSDGDGLTDCEETTGIDDPSTVNVPVGVTDPSDACDPIEGSDLTDSDGNGLTDCEETTGNDNPNTAGVPVGITDPNNPCDPFTDGSGCTPIAVDDNASTTPDTNVTFPITDNDSDPSAGGSIDVTSVDLDPNTPGQQGTFTVPGEGTYTDNGDGTVTFDPEPGFTGVATPIDYTVNDNDGNPSNIATVTVTVASCPSPIDSDGDGLTDCEETTGIDDPSTVNVPVGVTDPSDACDPIEGSDLTDSDGDGLTDCEETTGNDNPNTAGVPVGITDPNNPCDPFTDGSGCTPIAVDDNASTTPDTNVTFPITDNDSDPSAGGSIDVTSVDLDPNTPGQQGTFTVPGEGTYTDNGDGTVTFDPEPGFTGVATPIDYTVNDNDGNPSNIATITVTVQTNPIAEDDESLNNTVNTAVTVPVILDNGNGPDSDADGTIDVTTISIITAGAIDNTGDGDNDTLVVPGEGTWVLDESGNITFTPEPGFTGDPTPISYTVDDNDGNTSNQATVTITYSANPIAEDDSSLDNTIGSPVTVIVTADNGNGADNDLDGIVDASTVSITTPGATDTTGDGDNDTLVVPGEGTWTVDESGNLTFTPEPGFVGNPTPITYTIEDNEGNVSNEATVVITYGDVDSDGDGVLDSDEVLNGTDPLDPCDYNVTDITEVQTEPFLSLDCDGDGVSNGDEVLDGTDPLNFCEFVTTNVTLPQSLEFFNGDCDNDNVPNGIEFPLGDTDGDGTPNWLDTDDDNDGVDTINEDYEDVDLGDGEVDPIGDNDPTNDDTDQDGIPDYLDVDDDGDGILTTNESPDPNNDGIGFGGDSVDSDGDALPDYLDINNASPSEDDLEVFNAVTPNGDGDNDVFIIRNIELYPDNTLEIYNRWGVIVYSTEGYGQNGKFFKGESNGRVTIQKEEQLPVGTYFYVLNYKKGSEDKSRAGYLYIQR